MSTFSQYLRATLNDKPVPVEPAKLSLLEEHYLRHRLCPFSQTKLKRVMNRKVDTFTGTIPGVKREQMAFYLYENKTAQRALSVAGPMVDIGHNYKTLSERNRVKKNTLELACFREKVLKAPQKELLIAGAVLKKSGSHVRIVYRKVCAYFSERRKPQKIH